MLLSEEFVEKTHRISKIWMIIFVLECSIGFILAIVAAAWQPDSATWLFEYLSWTKGVPNRSDAEVFVLATIWFPIYFLCSAVNCWFIHSMLRDTFILFRGKNKDRIIRLRKQLTLIMVATIFSIFTLILHGALWWINCIWIIAAKYSYLKEVKKLNLEDVNMNVFLLGKKIKRSLNEGICKLVSESKAD